MLFFNRTLLVRFVAIALVLLAGYSLYRRIDAIIDNYQKYYDIALIQKIWRQEVESFSRDWGGGVVCGPWEKGGTCGVPKVPSAGSSLWLDTQDDLEKKWEEYLRKSPFKAENKPVPQVADEYTSGYYHGLWNFFVTSGFAQLFALLTIGVLCILAIRRIWVRITEKAVERFFSRF